MMTEAELVKEIEDELRDEDNIPTVVAPTPVADAGDPGDEQPAPTPTESA